MTRRAKQPGNGKSAKRDAGAQGEIRTFDIPGDLPLLEALGHVRRLGWTEERARKQLATIETLLANGVNGFWPGVKGERTVEDGRVYYEAVSIPPSMKRERGLLLEAVRACQKALECGDMRAVQARMDGIERMIVDLKPRIEKSAAARKGGSNAKGRSWAADYAAELVGRYQGESAAFIWNRIPQSEQADDEPYRDGDKLVGRNLRTGTEQAISSRTFERYLYDARKRASEADSSRTPKKLPQQRR
jgi:hypothetical protein